MIERSGYPIIAASLAAALLLAPLFSPLSLFLVAFAAFTAFFFRDPEREIGEGIVSPADGKIIRLACRRIDIFMSPLDCHVNRSPVSGVVKSVSFFPGRKLPAFLIRGNECRNEITIESEFGEFRVTQVAGMFARRIVCYVKEGDKVEKGQRIGMIRFGSRVTLEVPEGVRFVVRRGQKVKAGQTVAVYENIQTR
ncbi:MAG: phosphatidylserine decarboxylase [Archaeoglobaceae archaeon]